MHIIFHPCSAISSCYCSAHSCSAPVLRTKARECIRPDRPAAAIADGRIRSPITSWPIMSAISWKCTSLLIMCTARCSARTSIRARAAAKRLKRPNYGIEVYVSLSFGYRTLNPRLSHCGFSFKAGFQPETKRTRIRVLKKP